MVFILFLTFVRSGNKKAASSKIRFSGNRSFSSNEWANNLFQIAPPCEHRYSLFFSISICSIAVVLFGCSIVLNIGRVKAWLASTNGEL